MDIDIEDLFEEKVLKRGYNYYNNDLVHDVTKEGNIYNALVYGRAIYEVEAEIDSNGNVKNMQCDCPYAIGNNCKHMAALLYYLDNGGNIESGKRIKDYDNFENILDKISESDIKHFVLQKLYEDNNLENEFRGHFAHYFEKTPKRVYKSRISQSIYQITGRNGFINYNETDKFSDAMDNFFQEARNLIKHKEYQAPFWIASLILEELPDLPIDDSYGTTSFTSIECVEIIEEVLQKCKDKYLKLEIFDWIKECLKNNTLDFYSSGVERLLDEYFIDD